MVEFFNWPLMVKALSLFLQFTYASELFTKNIDMHLAVSKTKDATASILHSLLL